MLASTVLKCLAQIFTLFGLPDYVHSDRGANFLSAEVTNYLHSIGVATSKTTPYNPMGNSQCERYNGIIWRTIELALKSRSLPVSKWELVVADVLHSIRSLLCTSTNTTPHDLMFTYARKSATGTALPDWLTKPGTVLMRRHVRASKYDPRTDRVELLDCNPQYAHVRLQDGRESTVSLRDLAPLGRAEEIIENNDEVSVTDEIHGENEINDAPELENISEPRRSQRESHKPDRLGFD